MADAPAVWLADDLDDDLDDGPAVAASTDAYEFLPEAIDEDGAPPGAAARAADGTVANPVLPPSLTRKRPRSKVPPTVHLDMNARPHADGLWHCSTCDATYTSRIGLFGHARFCEELAAWRCSWCDCTAAETVHKGSGPDGQRTLCSTCSSRYRAGHTGPLEQNDKGELLCVGCNRTFASLTSLASHRRFCDGGMWRCEWCECKAEDTGGKGKGPNGPMTLCSSCAARFRSGHKGPPQRNAEGRYVCSHCERTFDTISGLGSHRLHCDGGSWQCGWCAVTGTEVAGKGPGKSCHTHTHTHRLIFPDSPHSSQHLPRRSPPSICQDAVLPAFAKPHTSQHLLTPRFPKICYATFSQDLPRPIFAFTSPHCPQVAPPITPPTHPNSTQDRRGPKRFVPSVAHASVRGTTRPNALRTVRVSILPFQPAYMSPPPPPPSMHERGF